jgi:NAD(P)-dependent dehydrogenase (short-subunit alcohol dehydrogenase family)
MHPVPQPQGTHHEPAGKNPIHLRRQSRYRPGDRKENRRRRRECRHRRQNYGAAPEAARHDLHGRGGNRGRGRQALPLVCDIRFEDQVQAAVDATVERFGGIDICINNASAISPTPTLATEMKRYDLMNNINTRGTFLVSKCCIPAP